MCKYIFTTRVLVAIAAFVAISVANFQLTGPISTTYAQTETPADIVATQIRKQGYECGKAESAERDQAASKPDKAVWVLRCDNATYRVRLHPDMAAQVERVK